MRRIVLIDGENLTHALRELLGDQEAALRSELEAYDFRGLIDELLSDQAPSELLWFGARLRKYDQSDELRQKTEAAIAWQARFINHMQRQEITFIKVGYLRARQSDPCIQCGCSKWSLAEKGVDVGLAVRLLREASDDIELVVISADTDLLPAIKEARRQGAKIMHIGYEHRPIAALSQAADRTRLITGPLAKKYSKQGDL